MIRIRKRDLEALRKAMKEINKRDLFHALHGVGDDPTKILIEEALRQTLTPRTFNKVVAIFKLATDWNSPWFED